MCTCGLIQTWFTSSSVKFKMILSDIKLSIWKTLLKLLRFIMVLMFKDCQKWHTFPWNPTLKRFKWNHYSNILFPNQHKKKLFSFLNNKIHKQNFVLSLEVSILMGFLFLSLLYLLYLGIHRNIVTKKSKCHCKFTIAINIINNCSKMIDKGAA